MKGDFQARFRGNARVKFPRVTRLCAIRKTIMKKSLLFIFIIPLFTTCRLHHCDDPVSVGNFSLSQNEINLVPYIGNEILNFKDSLHNTLTFSCDYRRTETIEQRSGGPETCDDYYYTLESNGTFFTSSILSPPYSYKNLQIGIGIESGINFHSNPPYLATLSKYISFNVPDYSSDVNSGSSFRLNIVNEQLVVKDTIDVCHDTITIGNKHYSKVFELHEYYNWSISIGIYCVYPLILYYSKNDGIISIKMSNGQTFIISD